MSQWPRICTLFTLDGQGMKGLEAPAIKNKVALRASTTGSIFMDSVKVPHDSLLPKGRGLSAPFSCLNNARYVLLLIAEEFYCDLVVRYDQLWHIMGCYGRARRLCQQSTRIRA